MHRVKPSGVKLSNLVSSTLLDDVTELLLLSNIIISLSDTILNFTCADHAAFNKFVSVLQKEMIISPLLIAFFFLFANATGLPNSTSFDVYVLALSWPPASVPIEAHSRARHIMHQGEANAGFWTHGLWPTK